MMVKEVYQKLKLNSICSPNSLFFCLQSTLSLFLLKIYGAL